MFLRAALTPWALALFAATLPSCIFASVTTPLAYRSPTPADVGGVSHLGATTKGEACNHSVLGLVAWGDGGFAKAMEQAAAHAIVVPPADGTQPQQNSQAAAILADVQADTSALNILGIYQRRCTVIHAKVVQ